MDWITEVSFFVCGVLVGWFSTFAFKDYILFKREVVLERRELHKNYAIMRFLITIVFLLLMVIMK